jgi:hypothetical protein
MRRCRTDVQQLEKLHYNRFRKLFTSLSNSNYKRKITEMDMINASIKIVLRLWTHLHLCLLKKGRGQEAAMLKEQSDGDSNPNRLNPPCRRWGFIPSWLQPEGGIKDIIYTFCPLPSAFCLPPKADKFFRVGNLFYKCNSCRFLVIEQGLTTFI